MRGLTSWPRPKARGCPVCFMCFMCGPESSLPRLCCVASRSSHPTKLPQPSPRNTEVPSAGRKYLPTFLKQSPPLPVCGGGLPGLTVPGSRLGQAFLGRQGGSANMARIKHLAILSGLEQFALVSNFVSCEDHSSNPPESWESGCHNSSSLFCLYFHHI